MSTVRIIKRDPNSQDKEVILEIDPVGGGEGGVQTYSVKGKMLDEKALGVNGIAVRAYHKGLTVGSDILLGSEATSNGQGDYIIYYTTDLLPSGKLFADLQVKAFDTSGPEEVQLAESPIFTNALPSLTVNLSVSTKPFVGLSEYQQVKNALDPEIAGLNINEITENGAEIIADANNLAPKIVKDYFRSITINLDYPTISGEVFYGLFRYGLPYDAIALIEQKDAVLREALVAVTRNNIIDPDIENDIDAILAEFALLRQSSWLIDPVSVDGDSYINQILNIAGIPESPTNDGQREKFVGAYLEYGSEDDFWEQVATAPVFDDDSASEGLTKVEKRDNVRRAFQIGVITQQHVPLVSHVYNNTVAIEDIGQITRSAWLGYIDIPGIGVPNIEETSLTVLDKQNYADALMTASEKAFPTEVLTTFMEIDTEGYENSEILIFLQDNTGIFDIKDSSPRNFFKAEGRPDDETLVSEILELKRLWHLSSGFNKLAQIKLFKAQNLLSASQIANIGKRAFFKKYNSIFGEEETERIYKVAVKRSVAATKLQTNYNPAVNNISTQVFQDSPLNENEVINTPSLEVLFESQDFCTCIHCQSSFSPAAYLVDLLTFLRQTDVYNDAGELTGQTAWDVLQVRRPEFVKILLSCDNTNITLPYIDLVNEVLEHQVVAGNLERQTTRSKESLRVRPEHLNRAAYDQFFDGSDPSVYPWLLPFHLWNEEARAYLGLVNINRENVSYAFDAGGGILSQTNGLISLNISSALQTVLIDNSSFTKYYGGANTAALQSVKTLLDKSQLSYENLVKMLGTTFVNPNDIKIAFDPIDSCSLDDATLAFTLNEYKDLHRFERLRVLLDWKVSELDMALSALGATNIDDIVLENIAGIKKLVDRYRLTVPAVLSWYAALSDKSYEGEPSYYEEIFLNPIYNSDPKVIANFSAGVGIALLDGDQLDANNSPVLQGVLRLKAPELLLLINSELNDPNSVNKADLSHLYRVATFIRAQGISVQDFIDVNLLLEVNNPLTTVNPANQAVPQDTLLFIHQLDVLMKSDFSLDDIRFLLKHEQLTRYGLDGNGIETVLTAIRGKIQGKLLEKGIGSDKTREDLINLFLIFMNEADANTSIEIVDGVNNVPEVISTANDFIDKKWDKLIADKAAIKIALTTGGGSVTDLQERRDEVFKQYMNGISQQSELQGKVRTELLESTLVSDRTRENLITLFLFFMNEADANTSIGIVDAVNNNQTDIDNANNFIDQKWGVFVNDKVALKTALTIDGGAVLDPQKRRDEMFERFNNSANQLILSDEVTQAIADNYEFSRGLVDQVLVNELGQIGLFLNDDFVFSTAEVNTLSLYQSLTDTLSRLVKIVFALNKLNVEIRHVSFVLNNSDTTEWYDLKSLPTVITSSPTGFSSFLRLIQAYELEKNYSVPNEFSMIDLIQTGTLDIQKLSEGAGWNEKDIEFLTGSFGFGLTGSDYTNEGWLIKLESVFNLLDKLSISAEQLSLYKYQDVGYDESQALQAAIKSGFSSSAWQNVAVDVRDSLRSLQRDALSAYLIGNGVGPAFEDVGDLYEYFLLDTETAPCSLTSRIKLATSSVQLWVQRIRMDLEPNIKFEEEELDEWEWRKNYRVWEAARKVFLYPENWIEPELRDDKSPFFQDLEDELLQSEVTMESAESAYLNYLTKLDDVAVLEISGIYREEDRNILHVFARTKNIPHIYYYRTQEDGFRWTAWQRLDLDIEGDHLIPVVFNRRPMIFWPIFSEIPVEITEDDLNVTATNGTLVNDVPNKKPVTVAEVKLAYSEWKNNKWQPKKISKNSLVSTNGFIPANHFFKILIDEEGLRVDAFYHEEKSTAFSHIGGFVLNNCNSDIEIDINKKTPAPTGVSVKNAFRNNMKILEEIGNDQFAITERINYKSELVFELDDIFTTEEKVILNTTPGRFKITYPVTGVDLLSQVPFFFEDKDRVYFVNPSEEVFERTEITDLRLPILRLRRKLQLKAPREGSVVDNTQGLDNAGDSPDNTDNQGGGQGSGGSGGDGSLGEFFDNPAQILD